MNCNKVSNVYCYYGKISNTIKRGENTENLISNSCNNICGRLLQFGKHICELNCHDKVCHNCKECKSDKITTVINLKGKQNIIGLSCEKDLEIVYYGRDNYMDGWKLKPSIWANPFKVTDYGDNETVSKMYEEYIRNNYKLLKELPSLIGKKLACWCVPNPCRCDIMLKSLNEKKN